MSRYDGSSVAAAKMRWVLRFSNFRGRFNNKTRRVLATLCGRTLIISDLIRNFTANVPLCGIDWKIVGLAH